MVVAESGSRLAGDRCRLRDETGEARASRRKRDRRAEVVMPMCGMDEDGEKQWIAVKMDVDDGGADRATTPGLPRQKAEGYWRARCAAGGGTAGDGPVARSGGACVDSVGYYNVPHEHTHVHTRVSIHGRMRA